MFRIYKYRLYPTKKQTESLVFQLDGHRYLYNQALAERKQVYEQTGKGIGYTRQATVLLPKLKKENDNLIPCNYSSLQQTLRRLDRSFKAFFRRVKAGEKVGIDVGLNTFISTSDRIQISPPKYFRQSERKLVKAQRRLSHRKKGSNRRRKACTLVAKHHEHIANQRLDFFHKVTYSLVKNYDGFAVEKLNIKNMVKNRYLAKSIYDAGWGIFLNILKDKAESAGRWYQEVVPNGTSQICSSCSKTVKKSLAVRHHNCPHCGLSLDRDVNSALNILQRARIEPSWRGGALMPLVEARS